MKRILAQLSVFVSIGLLVACDGVPEPVVLQVNAYNPGEASVFPVSSTLISGPSEVILVDAQFQRNDANTVVEIIRASGKTLTTVYVSHGDPDYYFGLDVITAAFPDAKVVSSPTTHAYIKETMGPKNAYWGPILGDNAPKSLVLPEVLQGNTITVDGQPVQVIGLEGHDPKHTYLWVPSAKAVVGGVIVFDAMHAWMADSQTPESRDAWQLTLEEMTALAPSIVIPGHYLDGASNDADSIRFIQQYVSDFEAAAAEATTSDDVKAVMNGKYPDIGGASLLDVSAKVATGEMTWP